MKGFEIERERERERERQTDSAGNGRIEMKRGVTAGEVGKWNERGK